MKPVALLPALFSLSFSPVCADTVIEFKNQGSESQFLTNGKMARINTRGTDDYMLVNFSKKAIYSVTAGNKQIVNLSDSLPSISGLEPPKIRLDLQAKGNGPTIAGYRTSKYRLSANGEHCGTLYTSKEAIKGTAIENMFGTLKSMADSHLKSLGGFAALIPVCQLAQIEMANKLRDIGAPMRVMDKDGKVNSEITRILKNASVDSNYYALPQKYQRVSMGESIESALKQSPQTDKKNRSRSEKVRMMRY